MTGRLRMDEFIGDLRAERAQKVRVAFKKADMFVIRSGNERVDLYSKVAPVFEEKFDRRQGQFPLDEPAHELPLGDPFIPTLNGFLV